MSSRLFYSIVALVFLSHVVISDEVPVILWNIKGNALSLKAVSALGQHDDVFRSSLKEGLSSHSNILIFAVDKLSLEDFSSNDKPLSSNDTLQNLQSFLDSKQHMFLSSVKNPVGHVHEEAHCGVKEIMVDHILDNTVFSAVQNAFDHSCIVVLHLTNDAFASTTDHAVMNAFEPSFDGVSNDVVGVFTALHPSWVGASEGYYSRNLLASDDTSEGDSQYFINISGCLIAYFENATIESKVDNKTVSLKVPASTSGSKCDNSTAILSLSFTAAEFFKKVDITMNFTQKLGSWSTDIQGTVTGGKESLESEPFDGRDVNAPIGYSFSCGNLELRTKNTTKGIRIQLQRFQVQPFSVKTPRFSESFDCVTWFTAPIWMGVFATLIFVVVVNVGVYALFAVRAMDRFDDPKGKTITVAAATD